MDVVEDEATAKNIVIETTMIGNVDLKQLSLERDINTLASGRKNNSSRTSFEQRNSIRSKRVIGALLKIKNRTPGYYLIDIDKCHNCGIQPLKSKLIR